MKNEKLELLKLKMKLLIIKKKKNNEHFKLVDSPDYGGKTHANASYEKYIKYLGEYECLLEEIAAIEKNSSKKTK